MSGDRMGYGAGDGGTGHVPPGVLEGYVAGAAGLGPDVVWAVEVHLEGCAACRDRLGAVAQRCGSGPAADEQPAGLCGVVSGHSFGQRKRAARGRPPLNPSV